MNERDDELLTRALDGAEVGDRDDVRALVHLAGRLRDTFAVEPTRESDVRARTRALAALTSAAMPARPASSRRAVRRTALIAAVIGALLVAAVPAASAAIPGDPLYPVKLAAEQVRLAIAVGPAAEAAVYLGWTEERLDEAVTAQGRGDVPAESEAIRRYDEALLRFDRSAAEIPDDAAVLDDAEGVFASQAEILAALLETAPEAARPGLTRALEAATGHGRPEGLPVGRPENVTPGPPPDVQVPSDDGHDGADGPTGNTASPAGRPSTATPPPSPRPPEPAAVTSPRPSPEPPTPARPAEAGGGAAPAP